MKVSYRDIELINSLWDFFNKCSSASRNDVQRAVYDAVNTVDPNLATLFTTCQLTGQTQANVTCFTAAKTPEWPYRVSWIKSYRSAKGALLYDANELSKQIFSSWKCGEEFSFTITFTVSFFEDKDDPMRLSYTTPHMLGEYVKDMKQLGFNVI